MTARCCRIREQRRQMSKKRPARPCFVSGTDYDDENMLGMDGFDNCVVGVVLRFGTPPILCYSKKKVIGKLMRGGMSREGAEEFFEYNQIGDRTPCFIDEVVK